jgi:hypothetical protein
MGAAALSVGTSPVRADGGGAVGPARNLILLLAYGGWDTTYALDPKPGVAGIDAPEGETKIVGGLPVYVHASRPKVTSFFEKYGAACAIVNGIQVQSIVHGDCTKRLLTGTASDANPDVGAIVAWEHGRELPAPYLVLGPTAFTGPYASISARAGTVNQIRSLLTPKAAFPPADFGVPPPIVPDGAEAQLVRDFVRARAEREQAVRGQLGYNRARYADFLRSLERGDVLRGFSAGFGEDFTFTLSLDMQIDLALAALDKGVCAALHLEQAFATWDTHADNAQQAALHETLFGALASLAAELDKRPGKQTGKTMMDETVVAVVSEMGRTPQLNAAKGKDHWPVTSALLFGAGVRGGRVYGASGDELEARNVDFATGEPSGKGKQLQYGNFAAGLLELAGVDASRHLGGSEVFRAFIG